MQSLLSIFFEPKTNGSEITSLLVKLLDVKISSGSIKKELEEHPDYPSLLSISDVLTNYGIENLSISISKDKLTEVPTPFITQIVNEDEDMEFFTIVRQVADEVIHYYDPQKHKWDAMKKATFLQKCPGVVLLAEPGENSGEKEYDKNAKKEQHGSIIRALMIFWLPAIVLLTGIMSFLRIGVNAAFPFSYSLLTAAGSFVCLLLVFYELDEFNPVLQKICGASKKVDCGAILQSKAAKIIGIGWSSIGFSYFTGSLITQIFWGLTNPQSMFIAAWINVLAVPFVFYSIYYQWRIAKQWCRLCLFVQSLLVLQLVVSVLGGWHTLLSAGDIRLEWFLQLFTGYAIPFMATRMLLPVLFKAKKSTHFFTELQRLKHNPQIFSALLQQQEVVVHNPEGLGIVLGNPNAAYRIIKVCSPYCGPCADAHTPLEELLKKNPDVQLQIVFTASNHENDIRTPPVKHFLSIAEANNEQTTKKALDDWYLAEKKNYEVFAAQYPMNGELKKQTEKIDAMDAWCNKSGIFFTPTFFVAVPGNDGKPTDYHKLPDIYNVADLKYFFSV